MKKDNYFKALTGYRALAVYMVFCYHFNRFQFGSSMYAFFTSFRIGVPFFFVLSGFLIYNRYNTQELSVPFYKKYMLNRVARIYPVYFLVCTVTLLNYMKGIFSPYWIKVYLLNVTFLRGYSEKYCQTLVQVGWSLSVEETFYLIAPVLFLLAGSSIRKYFIAFALIFSLGWVLSYITIEMLHGFFWSTYKFMMTWTFFGHSFSFVVGIIVAILHNKINQARFKYFTWAGFVGLFLTMILMSRFVIVHPGKKYVTYTWTWLFLCQFVAIPFIGAIIWGLLRENTLISRLFSTEVFQVLGKSSYSFYLIHVGFVFWITQKYITGNVYGIFVILVLVSILMWKFIEEPLNECIRKKGLKLLNG